MITIGDIKLDTFVVLDEANLQCELKMPECKLCLDYGAKIDVNIVDSQVAGSAPNVAVGLSRLGKKTAILSVMGQDTTRPLAYEVLKREGVSTRYIETVEGEQSTYSVVLNYQGEKTILTGHIRHSYHLPTSLPKTKWMYVCEMGHGYERLYRSVAARVRDNGIKLGLNPGSIQIEERKTFLYDVIRQTHVLFLNREEAHMVTKSKITDIRHSASQLWKMGPDIVVITDGKNGSYCFDGSEIYFCPIFPGKAKEATGAGDAFATGFMAALMNGKDVPEGLRWGSVNASSVVKFVGPQAGLLTQSAIEKKLKSRTSFKVEKM